MADQIRVLGRDFIISGKIFRVIQPKHEWDVDIDNPHEIIMEITARGIKPDVFYFEQRLPHTAPRFEYFYVMDNIAAIPITSYEDWWKGVNRRVRLKVNKAQRLGVEVRIKEFNDELVRQIKEIFDDSPIRQGIPFRHYKKPFSYIKEKVGTFIERADFICAYKGNEPIGILKLVYTGPIAKMMNIVGKISCREQAPVNAMLAKAVERCAQKEVSFLTYGKLFYGKKGLDSVAQFKVHNGFMKYDLPRYYVPITKRGRIYIALGLYKKSYEIFPDFVASHLRWIRRMINEWLYGKK